MFKVSFSCVLLLSYVVCKVICLGGCDRCECMEHACAYKARGDSTDGSKARSITSSLTRCSLLMQTSTCSDRVYSMVRTVTIRNYAGPDRSGLLLRCMR